MGKFWLILIFVFGFSMFACHLVDLLSFLESLVCVISRVVLCYITSGEF